MSRQQTVTDQEQSYDPERDVKGKFAAKLQEYRETRATKDTEALSGPHSAAVYRRLILRSALTGDEFRYLCLLTTKFGKRLANCWPSRRTILEHLGAGHGLTRLDRIRQGCERKGFLTRVPLTVGEDDKLVEGKTNGRFISAVGYQFCLPAAISPTGHVWKGPRVWSNRRYAQRSRRG